MLYFVTTIDSLENISVDIKMPVFLTVLQIPDLEPQIKVKISANQLGRLALSIVEGGDTHGTLQRRLLINLKI